MNYFHKLTFRRGGDSRINSWKGNKGGGGRRESAFEERLFDVVEQLVQRVARDGISSTRSLHENDAVSGVNPQQPPLLLEFQSLTSDLPGLLGEVFVDVHTVVTVESKVAQAEGFQVEVTAVEFVSNVLQGKLAHDWRHRSGCDRVASHTSERDHGELIIFVTKCVCHIPEQTEQIFILYVGNPRDEYILRSAKSIDALCSNIQVMAHDVHSLSDVLNTRVALVPQLGKLELDATNALLEIRFAGVNFGFDSVEFFFHDCGRARKHSMDFGPQISQIGDFTHLTALVKIAARSFQSIAVQADK